MAYIILFGSIGTLHVPHSSIHPSFPAPPVSLSLSLSLWFLFDWLVYGLLVSLFARLLDCFTWLFVCYLPDFSLALFLSYACLFYSFFLLVVIISANCCCSPRYCMLFVYVYEHVWCVFRLPLPLASLSSSLSSSLSPSPPLSLSPSLPLSPPPLSLSLSLPPSVFCIPSWLLFVCLFCLFVLFCFCWGFFPLVFFSFEFLILNVHVSSVCNIALAVCILSRLIPLWARAECKKSTCMLIHYPRK